MMMMDEDEFSLIEKPENTRYIKDYLEMIPEVSECC